MLSMEETPVTFPAALTERPVTIWLLRNLMMVDIKVCHLSRQIICKSTYSMHIWWIPVLSYLFGRYTLYTNCKSLPCQQNCDISRLNINKWGRFVPCKAQQNLFTIYTTLQIPDHIINNLCRQVTDLHCGLTYFVHKNYSFMPWLLNLCSSIKTFVLSNNCTSFVHIN